MICQLLRVYGFDHYLKTPCDSDTINTHSYDSQYVFRKIGYIWLKTCSPYSLRFTLLCPSLLLWVAVLVSSIFLYLPCWYLSHMSSLISLSSTKPRSKTCTNLHYRGYRYAQPIEVANSITREGAVWIRKVYMLFKYQIKTRKLNRA